MKDRSTSKMARKRLIFSEKFTVSPIADRASFLRLMSCWNLLNLLGMIHLDYHNFIDGDEALDSNTLVDDADLLCNHRERN
jgi:hypothetical protein